MKRFLAALVLLLMIPVFALCEEDAGDAVVKIDVAELPGGDSQVCLFSAYADDQADEAALETVDAVNALIEERFSQARAETIFAQATERGGTRIAQEAFLYQDDRVASLGLIWQGRQADGTDGCSAISLALDLATGEELAFEDLFADADAVAARMEEIIERDIVWELSDYMEYADLLPMPRDCFWFDEGGFNVGYGDERYRYFSGRSGTVHFAWHELAELIDGESPLYAISRPQEADAKMIEYLLGERRFGVGIRCGVGEPIGDTLEANTLLADPDYARDSALGGSFRLYMFEESDLRGFMLETPLYADTPELETPVSGVRATRISWYGLTTGATTRDEIIALLGEPDRVAVYDASAARDAMIVPGESLIYARDSATLYAHVDETGTLAMLAIRDE